jgi:hypothetical protein
MFSKTILKLIFQAGTDRSPSLPSPLEEKKLTTLWVAHNNSYGQEEQESLSGVGRAVIQMMIV